MPSAALCDSSAGKEGVPRRARRACSGEVAASEGVSLPPAEPTVPRGALPESARSRLETVPRNRPSPGCATHTPWEDALFGGAVYTRVFLGSSSYFLISQRGQGPSAPLTGNPFTRLKLSF